MSKTTTKTENWNGGTSETEYLLQSPANAAHLKRSIEQYGQGLTKQHAVVANTSTVKLGSLQARTGREVELTDGDTAGMTWWNGLSEAYRRYWCLAAMTAVPAQAWKYFRLVTAPRKSVKVTGDD